MPGVIHDRQPLFNERDTLSQIQGATSPLSSPSPMHVRLSAEPIHRFYNVPNEDQWRGLFAAWHKHLEAVWQFIKPEAPWHYTEPANVGLLASANDKDGGVSMVELPLRRRMGGADEQQGSAGRFDLWLARGNWELYAEAKLVKAKGCTADQINKVATKLDEVMTPTKQLSKLANSHTAAGIVFVSPSLDWTSTTTAEDVFAELQEFESKLWDRLKTCSGTFQTSFALSALELQAHPPTSRGRHIAFPGVILCGRIHQTGAA
jgi:hypothetical protein